MKSSGCFFVAEVIDLGRGADILFSVKYPFLLIPQGRESIPFLITRLHDEIITDPILLTSRGDNLRRARLYTVDGVYQIDSVTSPQKPTFWNLLFRRNKADFWDLSISTTRVGDVDMPALIKELEDSVNVLPEDVWMQYHEKEVVLYLLRGCRNVAEIITVCCLIGMFDGENSPLGLPEINDNIDEYDPETISEIDYITAPDYKGVLTRSNIERIASAIKFTEWE